MSGAGRLWRMAAWLGLSGCFVGDAALRQALDRDGDGHLPVQTGGTDCAEGRPDVHPDAVELCGDGIDNDCDGQIDDDGVGARLWYVDADGDGYGVADEVVSACSQPEGYAPVVGDCDDGDPAVNPAVLDLCDGVDQNCNGVVDDDAAITLYYFDGDGDGAGDPDTAIEACAPPPHHVLVGGDCDDRDPTVRPGILDVCDGVDQNCDGVVDDDAVMTLYYFDGDGDGAGDPDTAVLACAPPPQHVLVGGDCDDADPTVRPGALDVCDGLDQDCDGALDEDATFTWYFADLDGDGVGNPDAPIFSCAPEPQHVLVGGDCDDTDATVRPGALDPCDGIDQDCDGVVDGDATFATWFRDTDGDGAGNPAVSVLTCDGPPTGYVAIAGDCDDADPSLVTRLWYRDIDGDGYGAGNPVAACARPSGHVALSDDCDDNNPARSPGHVEICKNHVDDDCNPATDCRLRGVIGLDSPEFVEYTLPAGVFHVHVVGDITGDPRSDLVFSRWDDAYVVRGGNLNFASPDVIIGECNRPKTLDVIGDAKVEMLCDTAAGATVYLGQSNLSSAPYAEYSGSGTYLLTKESDGHGPGVWSSQLSSQGGAWFVSLEPGVWEPRLDYEMKIVGGPQGILLKSTTLACEGHGSSCLYGQTSCGYFVFAPSAQAVRGLDDAMWANDFSNSPACATPFFFGFPDEIDPNHDGLFDVLFMVLNVSTGLSSLSVLYAPVTPTSIVQEISQAEVDALLAPGADFDGDGLRDEFETVNAVGTRVAYGSSASAEYSLYILHDSYEMAFPFVLHDLDGDGFDDYFYVSYRDYAPDEPSTLWVLYGSGP